MHNFFNAILFFTLEMKTVECKINLDLNLIWSDLHFWLRCSWIAEKPEFVKKKYLEV